MMTRLESSSDAQLVELSQAGNREAFASIVQKYQSLICGLTYSACGSIQTSEDLAQITFITAWCQLRDLRDPAKLKAWLCRIARNATTDSFRKQQRTPTANAEAIDSVAEIPSDAPTPSEQVMSKEEQAILWRALGDLPPNYREPLVLFYRQNQSVAEVAESLDLSEDVVKQRLSRGRAMLSEQVSRLVETTLRTSGPTNAFTVGVVAALPVLTASSSAATVGATAAKGSIVAKAAASVGLAGGILGSFIGVLGGLFGSYMSIKNTKSPRERRFMINMSLITLAFVGMFYLATFALIFVARLWWNTHPVLVAAAMIGVMLGYCVILVVLIVWANRRQQQIQVEDGTFAEASALRASAMRPPGRAAIYGSLGGCIFGGTTWLVVVAICAADWLGSGIVALLAVATFILSTSACLRHPQRYWSIAAIVCAGIGLGTLALINLQWSVWFGNYPQLKGWSAPGLSGLVLIIYGILTVMMISRRNRISAK